MKLKKLYIFCILMLLTLSIFTGCESKEAKLKKEAVSNFDTLSGEVQQLQSHLSSKIQTGENLVATTKGEELADASLLESLQSEIDSANKLLGDVPEIASETDLINQQVQELTLKKDELQKQCDSLDSAVNAIGDSKEAKLQEAISPKNSYSITATDSNGNKQRVTIRIGSWIKGSETELLDRAWRNVGGDGSMPITDGTYTDGILSTKFSTNDSAFVFGTVSVENLTPDFDAKNFGGGNVWIRLEPKTKIDGFFTDWSTTYAVQARQSGSGISSDVIGGSNPLVRPSMQSNRWGPMPFVIGIPTVFTPNFPDGDPALDGIHFFLSNAAAAKTEGDKQFQVEKSW